MASSAQADDRPQALQPRLQSAGLANPFGNPTPLSSFLEVLAVLLIPAALCYTYGRMARDTRQG